VTRVSIALLASLILLPFLARTLALLATRGASPARPAAEMIDDGAYLALSDGYVYLDAWNMPLRDTPGDAVRIPRTSFESITIHRKILEEPPNYRLFSFPAGERIVWTASARSDRSLSLEARAIAPGPYVLIAPTTSFYGGQSFHYFELTGP